MPGPVGPSAGELTPIPGPHRKYADCMLKLQALIAPARFIVGNLFELDIDTPLQSLLRIADEYSMLSS
jgi:hypothetical protein